MTNERNSVQIALEAILLLLYAWNSCPIPGMDISRSHVAIGREFAFPIDYSKNKHLQLTSSLSSVESHSKDLAVCLSALCEVVQLLVQENQVYHCKFINSHYPDPCIFTGPWRIIASLKGASYHPDHCLIPNWKMKKHAFDLYPYQLELLPFEPIEGPDNQYGQLPKPINANPYKEAGIKRFIPPTLFKATSQFRTTDQFH
jgi:hypothetical protein